MSSDLSLVVIPLDPAAEVSTVEAEPVVLIPFSVMWLKFFPPVDVPSAVVNKLVVVVMCVPLFSSFVTLKTIPTDVDAKEYIFQR